MVGVPDCGERHLRAPGAHGDPERRARGVRGRVGVAHDQTLSLQDDGFGLVLSPDRARREPNGTQQAKRQHAGAERRTSPPPAHSSAAGLNSSSDKWEVSRCPGEPACSRDPSSSGLKQP